MGFSVITQILHFQRGGRIVGLATDIYEELLFWSDTGPSHGAIFSSKLDGNDVTMIVTGE